MKKFFITIIITFGAIHFLFAQTNNSRSNKPSIISAINVSQYNFVDSSGNKYFNNGYYKWKVTGNSEIDAQNLDKAAEDFKRNNFNLYDKMICDSPRVFEISKNDLESMTEKRRK